MSCLGFSYWSLSLFLEEIWAQGFLDFMIKSIQFNLFAEENALRPYIFSSCGLV
jgi:hypothetical protein